MSVKQSSPKIFKRAALPAVFALGAMSALSFRGNATSPSTPVVPPTQALDMQSAFELVADKMRPSVVYIESLVKTRTVAQNPQGDGEGSPVHISRRSGGTRWQSQSTSVPYSATTTRQRFRFRRHCSQ